MKFSKDDQNTFLLAGAILVVCVVTIIIMIGLIWRIIAEPVKNTAEDIAYFFRAQAPINYNFEVPPVPIVEAQPAPQNEVEEEPEPEVKYDMPLREARVLGAGNVNISNEPLVLEVSKAKYLTNNDLSQTKFDIKIPSIGLDSVARHGSNVEFILQNGFLIYPGSELLGNGSMTLVCYRSQFISTDKRSCWNLDKLQKNDEIFIGNLEDKTRYKIVGTNMLNFRADFLYNKLPEDNYLQIITNDGNNRIVILAKKL